MNIKEKINISFFLRAIILLAVFFTSLTHSVAELRLPRLISDGMVLQRDSDVKIWGWADPCESVILNFAGKRYETATDSEGNWQMMLDPQPAGGPHVLKFEGTVVAVSDVYFGDVYLCSGQSNMELSMSRLEDTYPEDVHRANYPQIRQFLVPDEFDFNVNRSDLSNGEWIQATPEYIKQFSGVAYFFAKKIHIQTGVPIGLINSAMGGSPVEAWMSEETLKSFPESYAELQKFKSQDLIDQIRKEDRERSREWYSNLNEVDKGLVYGEPAWAVTEFDDSDWEEMNIPGFWSDNNPDIKQGVVWFRKEVNIPASFVDQPVKLRLGRIVDQDFAYINGQQVGTTGYQYPPRRYPLEDGVLKPGKNVLTVRIINNGGKGGFIHDKPYYLANATDTILLTGAWKYKQGGSMPVLPGQTFIRWKPGGLYKAMIHPLLNYNISGVLWYQGESNVRNADQYHERLSALIENWRSDWNKPGLPFYFVQLANFLEPVDEPVESAWARLRQEQLETLELPNTGMAVIIDVGEWNDIHPLNKKAVGDRLALMALNDIYKVNVGPARSPTPDKVKFKKKKVAICFNNVGDGLYLKSGTVVKYISISSGNGYSTWTPAIIKGKKIVVPHDGSNEIQGVRYAWANNPQGVNLYSKAGLPVSPFEVLND